MIDKAAFTGHIPPACGWRTHSITSSAVASSVGGTVRPSFPVVKNGLGSLCACESCKRESSIIPGDDGWRRRRRSLRRNQLRKRLPSVRRNRKGCSRARYQACGKAPENLAFRVACRLALARHGRRRRSHFALVLPARLNRPQKIPETRSSHSPTVTVSRADPHGHLAPGHGRLRSNAPPQN
jgi:hypothetical protein